MEGDLEPGISRRMWQLLETIHAVVYFAPEVLDAYKAVGLKGFWMGYFAGRSAPFGAASPELVTATFFNFHERMVRRALPDAWGLAAPDDVLAARREAMDRALRRLLGAEVVEAVAPAADLAEAAARACSLPGRPLFAAHAARPWPAEAHLRLWHAATLVREHRGDGHVAANVAAGFDGLAAHVMQVGTGAVPRETLQPNRGWEDDEWGATEARLAAAGYLDDQRLTGTGRDARDAVEHSTDRLALEPWVALGPDRTRTLEEMLQPLAHRIAMTSEIPYPNPMGLPSVAATGV
jgi:hypothetical protein